MDTERPRTAGRGWAYLGAILGGAVSLAANVAHSYVPPPGTPADWSPQTGAVISATFWPLAVFVAVEILVRVAWPTGRRWLTARFLGVLPVALVAAVVSYRHLSGLLAHYGEDTLTAIIGPLAIDGLMVMASAALVATGPATSTPPRHADIEPAGERPTSTPPGERPTGTSRGDGTAPQGQASLDPRQRQASLDTRPPGTAPDEPDTPARVNGHAIGTGVVR